MARVLKIVRWLVLLPVLPVMTGLTACDCFLEVGATVVDCTTSQPLAGVAVSEHIDMGFHEGSTKNDVATTKADGTFALPTDQTCDAWVTLRLSRTGYTTLETQVKGSPAAPLALCLMPAPPP
jgi:hypothetical protein